MLSHRELANAIRILSMDAVEKAKSGHPGTPMGMADIAEVLWRNFMNHNPQNPFWINRDRFVLSNGHASMLIYSLLHLTGYDLSIDDIKNFRQLHSKTPGHPEVGCTLGVDATTGPLGQGIANAVGMAIAEKTLAAQFNRPGYEIIDHYTYVFLGDGCMMEGISHEVCSLAGTLKLGKLIFFYDYNGVSIDGDVKEWFTDNTVKRFEAYGWHVISNLDGHNSEVIKYAIEKARSVTNKPSLLIFRTIIGFGSPNKAGTNKAHGAPLGYLEIALTKKQLDCSNIPFEISSEIYKQWDAKESGKEKEATWNKKFAAYKKRFPKEATELTRRLKNELPSELFSKFDEFIIKLQNNPAMISTRQASQNTIEVLGHWLPELLGGSADLTSSNLTTWSGSKSINKDSAGNYVHYGVREFGMTAIANGIALHGGFLPYTSTFLTFADYARNAIRMAAMMKLRHILIYTHDSIGLGEDGPTHQPVEQIASLRLMPNISIWRPCDQVESAIAWKYGIEFHEGPTVLIFSRQNLVQQNRNKIQLANIIRGGYVLKESKEQLELILIATGSEVALAIAAWKELTIKGVKAHVVSMPSTCVFDKQDVAYKESVLPKSITARVAIEAGIADYWFKYVGLNGIIVGMTTYGESAPGEKLFKNFGFTVKNIVEKAESLL